MLGLLGEKGTLKKLIALFLFATAALAQTTGHSAVLTWTAPSDAVAGSTYNVYRANAVCPTTGITGPTWTKITPISISALTYTDSTITAGSWCYYVTQVQGGVEGNPSTTAGGQAKPNTVTFSITIN